jgi:2-polyprenyl-3-methyl-5-hydroxy-6-metoxy-1,4-benzoquinol methylase
MNLVYHQACPVCQSTDLQPFRTCKDYTVSAESYQIVRCKHCKTALTQNSPNEQQIGRYYQAESYISHSNTRKGLINNLYHLVREYMLGRKRVLVEQVASAKKGKLLDIGCGTGYFLATMQAAGWQVHGIEADEKARNFAKTSFQLAVESPQSLENLAPASFDVISLWHVLEHLHDLNGYMNKICTLLKPQGTLLIAVPNYESHDADYYKEHWAAFDVPRHLWHFCPDSIDKLAKKHHFLVKQHHIMPFDSFYVALLSEKYQKNEQNIFTLFGGFLQGFISLFGAWRNTKRASSVIYVLKKE